jgi:hypothetical protein
MNKARPLALVPIHTIRESPTLHSTRRPTHPVTNLDSNPPIVPLPYTIKQSRTTPFPCNPYSTILIRVASPCIFRHPNWHSIVLRRRRMSTICQVHDQSWCPFLSQQPTLGVRGVPHVSQSRLISITKHQTHYSSLLHSLPFQNPLLSHFFPFRGYLETKNFHPLFHIGMWALYSVTFRFRFSFRTANLCVVGTQWVGIY